MKSAPKVFLIDNGSLRPQATFALRELAARLAQRTEWTVEAVSLLHSHKIPAEKLDGVPATIVRRRLKECIAAGERSFILLPLFLGPSLAISEYLPELIEEARGMAPDVEIQVAEPLVGRDVDFPDPRLCEMLADHVRATIAIHGLKQPKVALVDHGTPIQLVNQVRNAVAKQLGVALAGEAGQVIASSMERRDGSEYAFNEPLLENLGSASEGEAGCVVAMFFILPGRHAGEGGDVAEICDGLIERGAFKQVHVTPLLGTHSKLLEILADRLDACAEGKSDDQ
jgi:sirohydrochlorin ferrochelatase